MWDIGQAIGDKEGRFDVCLTAAGIVRVEEFKDIPAEGHRSVRAPPPPLVPPAEIDCNFR